MDRDTQKGIVFHCSGGFSYIRYRNGFWRRGAVNGDRLSHCKRGHIHIGELRKGGIADTAETT